MDGRDRKVAAALWSVCLNLCTNRYAQENVIKILVGNKSDMADKRRVTYEEGQEMGKLALFYELET